MADITFKHVKKVYDKGNVVVPDLNGIPELCSVSAYDRV